MPARFIKGDLFRHAGLDALAHGCNCAGAMGKGIAVEFKARYPRMYEEYKRRCTAGTFKPGDVFEWREGELTIFNLGTQATWRTKATLPAIEAAVSEMVRLGAEHEIARIGLPRIGAGLGGLRWDDVRALIARIGGETPVELVVFEEFAS
jgi:O-acetyl-ADP-ribose deacetylase (regulator of RNase III)